MKNLFIFLLLFVVTSSASAQTDNICPSLPAGTNLEWANQKGPDFLVCYANEPSSQKTYFGIYFGFHASFNPEQGINIGTGEVANKQVAWYKTSPGFNNSPNSRQTLIPFDEPSGLVAHIWITAETEEELKRSLSILKNIVFKK
jgi:hypothetical protein